MAQNIQAKQLGIDEIETWKGLDLFAYENKKLGKLKDVYLDDSTKKPKWGLTSIGLINSKELFVPLAEAVRMDDGVHIKAKKEQVEASPELPADGRLTSEHEHKLTVHYGLNQRSAEEIAKADEESVTMPVPEAEESDGKQPEATHTLPPGVTVSLKD